MSFTSTVVVRYAETDQMGVVHHANYPVWFELARTDFIKQIGVSYSDMEKLGVMLPVTDISCHYILPAKYEDTLQICVSIDRLTAVRICFQYRVMRGDQLLATGTSDHAWVDAVSFKPISLKKRLPEIYGKLEALYTEEKKTV